MKHRSQGRIQNGSGSCQVVRHFKAGHRAAECMELLDPRLLPNCWFINSCGTGMQRRIGLAAAGGAVASTYQSRRVATLRKNENASPKHAAMADCSFTTRVLQCFPISAVSSGGGKVCHSEPQGVFILQPSAARTPGFARFLQLAKLVLHFGLRNAFI